jgi:GH18 family chitinase
MHSRVAPVLSAVLAVSVLAVSWSFGTQIPDPCPNDGLEMKVHGYHVSWRSWTDAVSRIPWRHLTQLSYFAANAQPDGSVTGTDDFSTSTLSTLADTGDLMCVQVGLSLVVWNPPNTPDPDGCVLQQRIHDVLNPDPVFRTLLLNNIMATLAAGHADGVDVDIEFPAPPVIRPGNPCTVYLQDAQRYVDFVTQLTQRVHTQIPNSYVYVEVPQWDYPSLQDYYYPLAAASDGLEIMGYGYHYEGNDPGPVSPVFPPSSPDGGIWSHADPPYDLNWSLAYYRARGVPPAKLMLGFPFGGIEWPATSAAVPGKWTGEHTLTFPAIKDDNPFIAQPANDCERLLSVDGKYDPDSQTPYRVSGTATPYRQLFCEDLRSMAAKFDLARGSNIAGIFFWAENYLPARYPIYKLLDRKLKTNPPANQAPSILIGASQDASKIHLEGGGTTDPDGDMMILQWAMTSGPPAADDGVAAANETTFAVTAIPGNYTFSLTATDGDLSSTGTSQVFVPGDTTPPTVTLPALPGVAKGTVTTTATASDNVAVEHVDLLVDGGVVDTETVSPYGLLWVTDGFSEGGHTVLARAKDWSANSGSSISQTVIVDRAAPAPIKVSGPKNAKVNANFTLTVTASDANKVVSITLYEVPASGPLISKGTQTINPAASPATASFTMNYGTTGTRRFRATAADPAGNSGTSATDLYVLIK